MQDEPGGGGCFAYKMSLDEIRVFLKASDTVHFEGEKLY